MSPRRVQPAAWAGRLGGLALAAAALFCAGSPADPEALVAALADERFEVRAAAWEALAALDESAVPALMRARASDDPHVAQAAEEILAWIRSFPAALARWGRAGVREALCGPRWFVGYEDGAPRRFVYVSLAPAPAAGEIVYRFQAAFAVKDGPAEHLEGTLRGDLSPLACEVWRRASPRAPRRRVGLWRASPEERRVFYPMLAAWVLPVWEFPLAPQVVSVGLLEGNRTLVFPADLARRPEADVPDPAGARRGESARLAATPRGPDFALEVWWSRDKRLLQVVADRVHYFPVGREEAVRAAGGISWWE